MMGHKICFYGEIWQILPRFSLLPFLSGALLHWLQFHLHLLDALLHSKIERMPFSRQLWKYPDILGVPVFLW